MLRKIINSTKGKPCSCAEGKLCDGCKHKKVIKPQVYIEEPRRLTVPVSIRRFGHRPVTTVHIVNRKEPSGPRKTLCQWYSRRKALNELKKYQEQERKIEHERARRAREAEIIKLYQKNEIEKGKLERERQKQEYERAKAQREREAEIYELYRKQAEYAAAEPAVKKTKPKKIKVKKIKLKKAQREPEFYEEPVVKPKKIKVKKVKEKKIKEKKENKLKVKTISAKPKAESRYASVTVKRRSVVDSLSARFVNCCYKCCCQFYCWMTIILVIGLFLILYF